MNAGHNPTHLDGRADEMFFIAAYPIQCICLFVQVVLTGQDLQQCLNNRHLLVIRRTTITFSQPTHVLCNQLSLPVEVLGVTQQLFVVRQSLGTGSRFDHGSIQIPDTFYITFQHRLFKDVGVDVGYITTWTEALLDLVDLLGTATDAHGDRVQWQIIP
ncbi:hypothetical protein D3C80_941080 [compost metagenome]